MFDKDILVFDKDLDGVEGLKIRSVITRGPGRFGLVDDTKYSVDEYCVHDNINFIKLNHDIKIMEYNTKTLSKAIVLGNPKLAFNYKEAMKYGELVAEFDTFKEFDEFMEYSSGMEQAWNNICIEAVLNWRDAFGGCSLEALGNVWSDINFYCGNDEDDVCVPEVFKIPYAIHDWDIHALNIVSDILIDYYPDYIKNGHPWGVMGYTNDLHMDGCFNIVEADGQSYLLTYLNW